MERGCVGERRLRLKLTCLLSQKGEQDRAERPKLVRNLVEERFAGFTRFGIEQFHSSVRTRAVGVSSAGSTMMLRSGSRQFSKRKNTLNHCKTPQSKLRL